MFCKVFHCSFLILSVIITGCAAESDPFHYDYKSLRIGGLVFSGVMLTIGIIVLLTDLNIWKKKKSASAEVAMEEKTC
ncbi:FXYD domain-containing ion transport regulator 6-like [Aquarana catesbeiana]|uniref:FXYD domain-containing ion transport regulator 6-like n=1 Tax=Aquarana catesbeiana TaxID=8400 RepID=UPI003CCA2E80